MISKKKQDSSNSTILIRVIFYILGMLICAAGVSLFFHTYIAPEAYELFVKEISLKYGFNMNKVKTIYDCTSCIVAILMSCVFFGLWQFGARRVVKRYSHRYVY